MEVIALWKIDEKKQKLQRHKSRKLSHKTGIFIQARTGSTRLPQKMIRPFYEGKNMLEIILDRFIDKGLVEQTYLLTSTASNDDVLEQIASRKGVKCFRGSEQDVLDRFVQAAQHFKVDRVVRVCADNPLLDVNSIVYLIEHVSDDDDYYSFKMSNDRPVILNHIGLFAEYVKVSALRKVDEEIDDPMYHEHVTNYIHSHENEFNVRLENAPNVHDKTNIRLTCDTEEDFEMLQAIYKEVKDYIDVPSKIIATVEKNQDWLDLMQQQIKNYGK